MACLIGKEQPFGRTRTGSRLALFASTTVLRQGMGNTQREHSREAQDRHFLKGSCTESPRSFVMKLRSPVGKAEFAEFGSLWEFVGVWGVWEFGELFAEF